MERNINFCRRIVCLSLLFCNCVPSCGEVQNRVNLTERKSEIVQYGRDPQNSSFRPYMEKFMKVARQRYSDELKKDPAFEEKIRFFIETGEVEVMTYLIDEELVYLERHLNDVEIREKIWKKYLVDSDGCIAELDIPVVMFWLLYSDKVPTDVYREAWERYTRGKIEQYRHRYADAVPERIIYKDYFDNLLARLYPLACSHEELKQNPKEHSFYNNPSFHNFEEFVQEYNKKQPEE